MSSFDGLVAVVTGAGRGIGRACAELLAARGAAVVGVDVAETVTDPGSAESQRWRGVVGDIAEPATGQTVLATAHALPGRLAVLVNAAFWEQRAAIVDGTDDGWLTTYRISTLAAVALSRAFVAAVDGPAVIVNIASVHAQASREEFGAYAAAKAALVAFTHSAALEWGARSVRVNAVAPGFIAVERNAALWQGPQRRIPNTPIARYGRPEDIAHSVAFLASEDASFITGAVLPVDGGLLTRLPEEFRP
jgi:NAD(P)-dependent dehydrogenase (short-subunit alcohol dehydrogenase family)